jgi:hypothetical protein
MTMNVTLNHTLDVKLTPEQKDCLAIQLLQEMYRDAHEDVESIDFNPDNGVFSHPDDQKNAKRRLKAAKRLLWYYMLPGDYTEFLDSVEHGTEYTFNPEDYLN